MDLFQRWVQVTILAGHQRYGVLVQVVEQQQDFFAIWKTIKGCLGQFVLPVLGQFVRDGRLQVAACDPDECGLDIGDGLGGGEINLELSTEVLRTKEKCVLAGDRTFPDATDSIDRAQANHVVSAEGVSQRRQLCATTDKVRVAIANVPRNPRQDAAMLDPLANVVFEQQEPLSNDLLLQGGSPLWPEGLDLDHGVP